MTEATSPHLINRGQCKLILHSASLLSDVFCLHYTNHLHFKTSVHVCVCYREESTQPVHLLWILRSSVLVQSHHELLTRQHNQNNSIFTFRTNV